MTTAEAIESTLHATKDQVTGPAVLISDALTGIGRAAALAPQKLLFLAFNKASYITGASLAIDGEKLPR